MTQYDAAAVPMWRSFTAAADITPSKAVIPLVDINEKNTALNKWQRLSDTYDFTTEDAVPDIEFNEVLCYAVKGTAVPFPGPKRAVFLKFND